MKIVIYWQYKMSGWCQGERRGWIFVVEWWVWGWWKWEWTM